MFHPDHVDAIDDLAAELLGRFLPHIPSVRSAPVGSLAATQPVAHLVAGKGVRRTGPLFEISPSDRRVQGAVMVGPAGVPVRYPDAVVDEVYGLAELAMEHASPLQVRADLTFVVRATLSWFEARHSGSEQDLSSYLAECLTDSSESGEYWMAIAGIHIPEPFRFAGVQFDFIPPNRIASRDLPQTALAAMGLVPGQVVAKVRGDGVLGRVVHDTTHAVDLAVDLLRFFHPGATLLRAPVGVIRRALVCAGSVELGVLDGDQYAPRTTELHGALVPWTISAADLAHLRRMALDPLEICLAPSNSDFRIKAVAALRAYARGLRSGALEDRVVGASTAAEVLLLRRGEQRKKENLSRRIAALFHHNHMMEYREAAAAVGVVYKVRSDWVHDGNAVPVHREESVRRGLCAIWMAIAFLVGRAAAHGPRAFEVRRDLDALADQLGFPVE